MTAHPIDTEALRARAEHVYRHGGPANAVESLAANVPEILDRLAAAEHRATRAEARIRHLEATAQITVREALRAEAERDEWRQTALDERGAALDLLEQIKVRDRRIQAVQHLVDQADHAGDWTVTCTHLQWAIDGTTPHPYRASETA